LRILKFIHKIILEILVIIAKLLLFLKKIVVSLGSLFVLKPGKSVLRVFFYAFIVRGYQYYYSLARKLGWKGSATTRFRIGKELVHFLAIGLTVMIIFSNFANTSRAQDSGTQTVNDTILGQLVKSEFGTQEEDQLIEEFFDQEQVISPLQQSYLDNLANVKTQPRSEMNPSQADETQLANGDDMDPSFVRPGMNTTGENSPQNRRETVAYEVQDGDTISTIAEKFGIGVSTILWENDLNAYSVIRPGDKLDILPVSGVTHKVTSGESLQSLANKYGVSEKDIVSANDLTAGQGLVIGQKLIVPGGRKEQFVSQQAKTYSGFAMVRDIIKPIKSIGKSDNDDAPKKSNAPRISNKMTWPTVGYRITQYFSWRHFAIDIANHVGTPLYAADAGVIESAGWGRGYGNNIVINHGGGKKTRYAHLSAFNVSKGDVVEKGEQVGLMGSTGWSTGPHIHFEVIINGVKYNPLNYVR
jgi:LysM repeat protein